MAPPDTKDTILDAAESLFAEQGFAATSLRQLTTRAGVNLAAVNYHFGGKEELARAVLLRRIQPINDERLRRLDALERPARLEAVVRAFLEPALQCADEGDRTCADGHAPATRLCRVFGRISIEQPPFIRGFLTEQFRELGRRFVAMLREAAPGIDAETAWWRMHFTIGAMAHTLQNAHLLDEVSDGACTARDPAAIVEHLVAFATAGFAAPEVTR
ncbi:MAG TPA: TetR/AcrR family transcriptional regulator [bacterium]|nr:TetR/AcrR family transcriptional regulator [bacterium]